MKFYLFLLVWLGLTIQSISQSTIILNENFENFNKSLYCSNRPCSTNPFSSSFAYVMGEIIWYQGLETIYTPGWDATMDSPDVIEQFDKSLNSLNKFVTMGADATYTVSEGVYFNNLALSPTKKYRLTIDIGGLGGKCFIKIANNLVTSYDRPIQSVPNQTILTSKIDRPFETVSVEFIPNQLYTQLWIYHSEGSGWINIDNIIIEEIDNAVQATTNSCCGTFVIYNNLTSINNTTNKEYIEISTSNITTNNNIELSASYYTLLKNNVVLKANSNSLVIKNSDCKNKPYFNNYITNTNIAGNNIYINQCNFEEIMIGTLVPESGVNYQWTVSNSNKTPSIYNLSSPKTIISNNDYSSIIGNNVNTYQVNPFFPRGSTTNFTLTASNECGNVQGTMSLIVGLDCYQGREIIDFTISDSTPINNFEVYPNPNSGVFNIVLQFEDLGNTSFSIYNANGLVIMKKNLGEIDLLTEAVELDTSAQGIYIIKVVHNGSEYYKKVTINN